MTGPARAFDDVARTARDNLLVIAPPGCGKTELLAVRADGHVDGLGPYQRILALTFSNKAKANLHARLRKVMGRDRAERYVTVRNFHGHAAELIRAHGATLGIDPGFRMPDRNSLKRALAPYAIGPSNEASLELARQVEAELRDANSQPRTDDDVLAHLCTHGTGPSLEIEQTRQAAGDMFYDDLLRHAQRLLHVQEIAALYQAHYGAVVVDEFQDLSPQQLDIAVRSTAAVRTFAGDPLQGIYTWAGARPRDVEVALVDLCGVPESLGTSFRSSPAVLAVVNSVSSTVTARTLDSAEPGRWHDGGIAAWIELSTERDEAHHLVDIARRLLAIQPATTIGVISRAGWRRQVADAEFTASGLPVTRWDLAVDDARIATLLLPIAARFTGVPDWEAFRTAAAELVDPVDPDTLSDVLGAVDTLSTTVGTGEVVYERMLAELRALSDPTTPVGPGVHLLNAHTGKGQQFDWVLIPGLEGGHIPSFLAKTAPEREEELRVLIVMLSRARHGLVISRANTRVSKAGRTYSPDPCPWLRAIQSGGVLDADALRAHIDSLPPGHAY